MKKRIRVRKGAGRRDKQSFRKSDYLGTYRTVHTSASVVSKNVV